MAQEEKKQNLTSEIAVLDSMKREIALIQDVPEAKDLRAKAEALRSYAQNAHLSLKLQNTCAEMRLRYERRAGELLKEHKREPGETDKVIISKGLILSNPKLAEMGITSYESSRWQRVARIPDDMFERFLDETKAKANTEITTAAALKIYRTVAGEETRSAIEQTEPPALTAEGQVIHGDMIPKLTDMDEGFADLIVTDPPYGLGDTADIAFSHRENMSKGGGEWDREAVVPMFGLWSGVLRRAIKAEGSLYCFVADRYVGEMWQALEEKGFKMQSLHVWHKTNSAPSVRKASYRSNAEFIIYATVGDSYTRHWLGQDRMKKCLEFPVCGGNERLDHPTQKPLRLLREYIEVSSNAGDLVLDPFAGVGSTGVAAAELGRRYFLIERDGYYYKQACLRLQRAIHPTARVF